jgi:hypothetical protein
VTTTSLPGSPTFDRLGNAYIGTAISSLGYAPPYGIDVYSPAGLKVGTISTGTLGPIRSMTTDNSGNLYFASADPSQNQSVYELLPDRTLTSISIAPLWHSPFR